MNKSVENDQNPITKEELRSATTAATAVAGNTSTSKRPAKNAFTELMSKKAKSVSISPKKSTHLPSSTTFFYGRDGLGAYTTDPAAFGPDVIVYHNDDFVVIKDRFPKASVHLLILPRDPAKQLLHPFDAFQDSDLLERACAEVKKVKALVASELRRRFGSSSAQDAARNAAMSADDPPDELPAGRDWEASVISGVHAHPSMNHLHVHVMSIDRHSDALKHRKHYNSFATPFLVSLDDMPIAEDDVWRRKERFLDWDMKCWRCGKNFGNKFARLKEHLEDEFKAWRVE